MTSPNSTLVTLAQPRSTAAEAYRSLRTNLMFAALDQPLSTLVVTGPTSHEAKSLTAANLAVTLAQGGRRTILVDCDLRRPAQSEIWNLSKDAPGLTTLVLDHNAVANPPLVDVGIENLSILPTGLLPLTPADLLSSRKLEEAIAALKSRADILLFDAPPVLAVSDAALLASKLDGLLLVMSAGGTRREHAQRAKDLLERVHIRIVGTVLTDAPVDASLGGFYSQK